MDIGVTAQLDWGNFLGNMMLGKNVHIGVWRQQHFGFVKMKNAYEQIPFALIGLQFFESCKILFDLKSRRIYAQKQAEKREYYPLLPFGLVSTEVKSHGKVYKAYIVVRHSPAWRAGLRSVIKVVEQKHRKNGSVRLRSYPFNKPRQLVTTVLAKRQLFSVLSNVRTTLGIGEQVIYFFP